MLKSENQAYLLWKLLDDIDTLDDACRSDDKAFRDCVRSVQQKRFEIMPGEEWDALAVQASDTAAK